MPRLALTLFAALMATTALADGHDARPEITIATPTIRPTHGGLDTSNYAQPVVYNVFDRIVTRDYLSTDPSVEGTPSPGLATSWAQIDDVTWELTVRQGVTFHDGTPMTAADVAFAVSPERAEIRPSGFVATIESAEAVDAETVRITTKGPDPVLLWRLASPLGHVVPKEMYIEMGHEAFSAAPVGTGPYRFIEKVDGDRLVLEANDDYWGTTPPLRRITFREVPEVSTRIANLVTGEMDMAISIPPDQKELVDREESLQTKSVRILNNHQLVFNSADPANIVHDKRIRQAMMLSMPRPQLVDVIWGGLTEVPDGYNWDEFGAMAAENPMPAYDTERARALLAEAGYGGETIELRFVDGYYVNMGRALQVAQQEWAKVGLNVELGIKENWTQLEWQKTDFDMWAVSADLNFNDPLSPMWVRWNPDTGSYAVPRPESEYGNWAVPAAYAEAGETLSTSMDPAVRKAAWQTMHDILIDDVPHLPLYRPVEIWGFRADIDWAPYPLYWMDFRAENFSVE
ncbi:MAG: ABC transporter substrate-binding protein [Pseudomonadota bacterium]